MKDKVSIFWFRRDLRLNDNTGLSKALGAGFPVIPLFIFDPLILDRLESRYDRRVDYIHQALSAMDVQLQAYGSSILTIHAAPIEVFGELIHQYEIMGVYCNRDYEPEAIQRDTQIRTFLSGHSISLHAFKDQVIFEQSDIIKNDGTPYTVFTPYSKKWRDALHQNPLNEHTAFLDHFYKAHHTGIPSIETIGFEKTDILFATPELDEDIIKNYDQCRDYPAMQGTSQLGMALRFGTISIRKCVLFARQHNETWLSELIWREFFMQILFHFPEVVHRSFKSQYDRIQWRNEENEFRRWCRGETGYPIVDAGMRQLNQTGFMHNRVRMVAASFLCKHLLIDWRWGEAYFAQKLNDYDLSANNGNWQWAAGCGCDAAPYFRIFNPSAQTQKFDKNLEYIKRWHPEHHQISMALMVDHETARERALNTYKNALQQPH